MEGSSAKDYKVQMMFLKLAVKNDTDAWTNLRWQTFSCRENVVMDHAF